MPSKLLIITAAVAAALPVALAALPYLRQPTPKPSRPPPSPPAGVVRTFTPGGLEILVARPPPVTLTHSKPRAPRAPILLLHGAVGTAMVWNRWLPYLASKGRTVYAVSLSGYGESPRPQNFVYMGLEELANDLHEALIHILLDDNEAPEPVLIAHSSGGCLAQYALDNADNEPHISALVLLSSPAPGPARSGGSILRALRVLLAWTRLDPCLVPRTLWHKGDLRSPLSTPRLVRRALFGPHMHPGDVRKFFDRCMNHEVAVSWLRDTIFLRYADPRRVKAKIPRGRVLCIGGDRDAFVTPNILRDTGIEYGADVVMFRGDGHYVQNDVHWREAADFVLEQVEDWGL